MKKYLPWAFAGTLLLAVPLYAWAQGTMTSPTLNEFATSLSPNEQNQSADITTATTSDLIPILDVSETPDGINYGDGANILEMIGTTATAAELNMAADSSANVEIVTTTNVIAAAESGTTYFLNSATGFVNTLPAPAAGLRFRFVVTTQNTSGNSTIVTNASANVIEGGAVVLSTFVPAANEDSINIVASTTLVGDWIEVISDGTSWFVSGQSGATGGVTFTAT